MNELTQVKSYDIQLSSDDATRAFDLLQASDATRSDYKARIGLYIDFINVHGLHRNTLIDFRHYLADRTDYSISTKNKYLTAARKYSGILFTAGVVPIDISKDISGTTIKGFRSDRKHKKDGIQADEIERLASYLQGLDTTPTNLRLRAMFTLLMLQGLRQIELTRLDVTDLDLRNGKAFIRGKGRDDKEPIALHPTTVQALADYLDASRKKSGPLFTSESNNSQGRRLTTRGIRKTLQTVLDNLNIDNSVHGFRHYFTTTMVKHYGGDLLTVAHYTRHRSLEMLQVYNDAINAEADLPRYYDAFKGVQV